MALLLGLPALLGCAWLAPTPVPVRSLPSTPVASAHTLVVFLPGRGGAAEDFRREGFEACVSAAGLGCDMVAVDAHLGYYMNRTVVTRIREDIIEPARARGFDRFVLVGVSMGGLGAVLYARQYPRDVNVLVLIAPFLGDQPVLDEVQGAGGLGAWKPARPIPDEQYQRQVWEWLRGYAEPGAARPALYLGYGTEDRFLRSHRLLGAALPPGRVFDAPGGHDWEPWRAVFQRIVASRPF